MINALQSELTINVLASIIVSLLFLALGFVWGKYKERRRKFGRNLEEYDFYPFTVTRENFGEFSLKARSAQRVTGRILDFIIIGALLLQCGSLGDFRLSNRQASRSLKKASRFSHLRI